MIFPAALTGATTVSSLGDTFSFNSLGVSSTTNPGTYTIYYATGCSSASSSLLGITQEITVP
jgi:hypothetical protein